MHGVIDFAKLNEWLSELKDNSFPLVKLLGGSDSMLTKVSSLQSAVQDSNGSSSRRSGSCIGTKRAGDTVAATELAFSVHEHSRHNRM